MLIFLRNIESILYCLIEQTSHGPNIIVKWCIDQLYLISERDYTKCIQKRDILRYAVITPVIYIVIDGYDGLANNTKANEYNIMLRYVTSDSCEVQFKLHMKTVTTKEVHFAK